MKKNTLLLTLVLLLVALTQNSLAQSSSAYKKVYVIQVNDTHGRSTLHHFPRVYSRIMSLYRQLGRENCVVVHTGDLLSRGSGITAKTRGAANVAFWTGLTDDPAKNIDCKVWVPGNGDFYGKGDTPEEKPYKFFPSGKENAQFLIDAFTKKGGSVLLANLFDKKDPKKLAFKNAKSDVLLDIAGVKVGFVGLTYVHPNQTVAKEVNVSYDYDQVLRDTIDLIKEKAEIIIPVSHIGYVNPELKENTCQGEYQLASRNQGFPALLGAHDHKPREGTRIRRTTAANDHELPANLLYSTVTYGNTGFGLGDKESLDGSGNIPGQVIGLLTLYFDTRKNKVATTRYQFVSVPSYYGTSGRKVAASYVADQKACEVQLQKWIKANAKKDYLIKKWGPLTYNDLSNEWPKRIIPPAPVPTEAP